MVRACTVALNGFLALRAAVVVRETAVAVAEACLACLREEPWDAGWLQAQTDLEATSSSRSRYVFGAVVGDWALTHTGGYFASHVLVVRDVAGHVGASTTLKSLEWAGLGRAGALTPRGRALGVALVAKAWARFRRMLFRDAVLVAEHFVIGRQHVRQFEARLLG